MALNKARKYCESIRVSQESLKSPFSIDPVGSILLQKRIDLSLTPEWEVTDFITSRKETFLISYGCVFGPPSLSITLTNVLLGSSAWCKKEIPRNETRKEVQFRSGSWIELQPGCYPAPPQWRPHQRGCIFHDSRASRKNSIPLVWIQLCLYVALNCFIQMDPGSAIGSMPGYPAHPIELLKQVNSSDHFLKTRSDQLCVFRAYPLGSWCDNQPQISEAKSLTGFWPVPGPPLQISYCGSSPHTGVQTIPTAPCAAANASGPLAFSRLTAGGRVFHFAELRGSFEAATIKEKGTENSRKGKGDDSCLLFPPRKGCWISRFQHRVGPVISFWIAPGLLSYLHQKKNCLTSPRVDIMNRAFYPWGGRAVLTPLAGRVLNLVFRLWFRLIARPWLVA